jgi:hypothetical protein
MNVENKNKQMNAKLNTSMYEIYWKPKNQDFNTILANSILDFILIIYAFFRNLHE